MFKKNKKTKRGTIECPYCKGFTENIYKDDNLSFKISNTYLQFEDKKEGNGVMIPVDFCPKCGKKLNG